MNLYFLSAEMTQLVEMHPVERHIYPAQSIDLIHKSHDAPAPYPTMNHFVTEMCMLLNGALWDFAHCIVGFVRWVNSLIANGLTRYKNQGINSHCTDIAIRDIFQCKHGKV